MRAEGIRNKRAYEPALPSDGTRILVDRLWPRGLTKAAAAIEIWAKELAPSEGLRRWFGHEGSRFLEFRRLYLDELARLESPLVDRIRELSDVGTVTLVYAARDPEINHALVLRDFLVGRAGPRPSREG
ncbi:MAG TPA: DUF488 family protein [Rectinemataceae bacterium]|nr:DUF488 family protein [Rectinemataceae bacterium]